MTNLYLGIITAHLVFGVGFLGCLETEKNGKGFFDLDQRGDRVAIALLWPIIIIFNFFKRIW